MTGQTGSNPDFNARADAAALAVKDALRQQGRNVQDRQVAVGPDGKPPPPPPPKGSYLRMEMERRAAEGAPNGQQSQRTPPAQERQAQAEEAHEGHEVDEQLSVNATRRFAELTGQLREREKALIELSEREQSRDRELANVRAEMAALKAEHERLQTEHRQILEQSLEGLDPETRATVLMESRMQRMLEEQDRRSAARLEEKFKDLDQRAERDDYLHLASKFELFDLGVHKPQIERFRRKNPNATIEEAYKAIAEPEALVVRNTALAASVPPVLAPGPGPTAEHFVPRPKPDEEQQMRSDAKRVRELMASNDPRDHRDGVRLAEKNIRDRLANRF